MKQVINNNPMKIAEFAKLKGLSVRQVQYRLSLRKPDQVVPYPEKFGPTFRFSGDEQIIIPPRPKPTGRPKGTTIANGAKRMAKRSLKYPRNKAVTRKIKGLK